MAEALLASASLFLGFLFEPKDGANMFLGNVGISQNYMEV
jgi:hypothetical protein